MLMSNGNPIELFLSAQRTYIVYFENNNNHNMESL